MRAVSLTAVSALFLCSVLSACSPKTSVSERDLTAPSESLRAAGAAFKELDDETSGKGRHAESAAEREAAPKDSSGESSSYKKGRYTEEKPSPARAGEKKLPGTGTVYPVINGYPVWVTDPAVQGYAYTAVGSAASGSGGLPGQKRAARIQAMGELSRMIKVKVDNELSSLTVSSGSQARSELKTYSRQRSEGLLNSVRELDSWINPENGDFYLLLGIEGE